jgi:hypothetical protein
MRKLAIFGVLLLSGCAAGGEIVYLRRGDEIAKCGPYSSAQSVAQIVAPQTFGSGAGAETRLRGCIDDYQRAGYERVPEGSLGSGKPKPASGVPYKPV